MYPRNAASPPRLAFGAVVAIADGAVQTADVLIKVTPECGAAAAGEGTTSYVEGVVHYVPTQAETNYTAFTVTAYKTSCIPAAVTVVTTASATAGRVDVGSVAGTAQTARDLGASVLLSVGTGAGQLNVSGGKAPATIAAGDIATDAITAAAVKADAVTKIQSGLALASTALSNLVWTDAKAGYLTGAVALEATLTALKGAGWTAETLVAIFNRIGAPAGASVSADVAAVLAQSTLARKILKNRMTIHPTSGLLTLYEDDGVTPLYTATLTDKDGNAPVLTGTGPANRTALA